MYNKYLNTLSQSPLFYNIHPESISRLLECMNPVIKEYSKNDVAAVEGNKINGIGIVLDGTLNISKNSVTGSRIILDTVEKGDLFGEMGAFTNEGKWPATVESQSKAKVLYISPRNIVEQCARSCIWHRQLQRNMLAILSLKALNLTKRIEYMAIKGLKAKLCTYLFELYKKTGKKSLRLTMKRYELADFFNVTRPSLSREMINLKREGVLDFSGACIKLLDIDKLEDIIEGE